MTTRIATVEELTRAIRDVPDFPKPGLLFKDITPLLNDPAGLSMAVELMANDKMPSNKNLTKSRLGGVPFELYEHNFDAITNRMTHRMPRSLAYASVFGMRGAKLNNVLRVMAQKNRNDAQWAREQVKFLTRAPDMPGFGNKFVGYVAGTVHKLCYRFDGVIYLYILNGIMVAVDIAIHFRNRQFAAQPEEELQGE